MIPQLFLDLDGVLADTAKHYRNLFNEELTWTSADFPNMAKHGSFYKDQPLMPDAMQLWEGAKRYHPKPIILTGAPQGIPGVAKDKEVWARKHFGRSVRIIVCSSADKRNYALPRDVLVDDREKYSHLWRGAGGIFILHRSAHKTLTLLSYVYTLL